jgi:hypothetical protein
VEKMKEYFRKEGKKRNGRKNAVLGGVEFRKLRLIEGK